jgi:PadR family transcriptional regulator, regulatory protein PadR
LIDKSGPEVLFLEHLGENRLTQTDAELLQGTLDLLILKTLALEPMHGYGVSIRIQQISRDVLRVQQGSLYPALYRLEHRGLITYEWGTSENGRRAKYYRLTKAGEKRLESETASWERLSAAVTRILQAV